jgi:putative endopeptidase
MERRALKKILTILMAFIMSILLPLSDIAYAYNLNLNLTSVQNDRKVEIIRDTRVQDDFYNAVNKEWLANTVLEEGCISYGTFEEVCGKVNQDILNIILEIQRNKDKYEKNSDEIRVINLFNNYLNINKRNELGIKPLEKYINKIDEIKDIEALKCILGDNEFSYFQPLINLSVGPDYKDSSKNVLYISNSNLGLGNSLYYKDTSRKSNEVKQVYVDYVIKLHNLCGENLIEAKKHADIFYEIEKGLAQKIPSYEEEARDENRIEKSYNVYTLKKLEKLMPNINFSQLLSQLSINKPDKIIVENPEQLKLVNALFTQENLENMKSYLKTNILLSTDNFLTSAHREASNKLRQIFYGAEITDLNEFYGVKFVNNQLNEIISKLYVNRYFDKESKVNVENMAREIIKNFENRLQNNSWMSKRTKEKAIKKLENINVKIGYPDKWNDYSNIQINSYDDGGTLVENILNVYVEQSKQQFSKLNQPVNKNEWHMGACTVNAYYNALNNEIVFPAGILQAPFYDKNANKEKNLGGIGAVIGHELTHAFDNTGSQFDDTGRLKKWWSEKDYKEFTNRSKKVVEYYSNIKICDEKCVNGFLTVGENISDLGGIACVLDIAKKNEEPKLKELFENYATIWREVSTKELKEYLLNNDPHAPKKVRVNVVLSQFEDFYKTYNIKEGDKMYVKPEDRVGIW